MIKGAKDGGIILVGDRHVRAVVDEVCRQVPVVGVVGVEAASAEVGGFAALDDALRSTAADAVCMLSPKQASFISICNIISRGVHLLCAGPLSATENQYTQLTQLATQHAARIHLGGRQRHVPRLQKMNELRASDAFGEPVYARCVAGGGISVDTAWWSMCVLLATAAWLLQCAPTRIVVAATRNGRARLHVTLTVALDNRANAQLCVVPGRDGTLADTWLLGSGGTISSRCEDGDILIAHPDQRHILDATPASSEVTWIRNFLADDGLGLQVEDESVLDLSRRLLPAIRRALKEGRMCEVS